MADLARGFSRLPGPSEPEGPDEDLVVIIEGDAKAGGVSVDPSSGAVKIEGDGGVVVVDFAPRLRADDKDSKFDENLADRLDGGILNQIAGKLLHHIEVDDQSREKWLQTRARGIDLLGFEIEDPRGDTGASTAPVEGMSVVRHFLLTEATLRFQANASAELLPAAGPVKVRNDGGETQEADELAEALERGFNHYLTATDKGYRADTDRMLFWVGFGGVGFKKVYNCPIKRMPISRSIDAADLIVSNDAVDLEDAGRVTHRIMMRKSTIKRMQIAGVYRDIELGQPYEQPHAVDEKIAQVQGFDVTPGEPEDHEYTVYECYCELNIQGYEDKEKGQETGLALPYKVTIEKTSRQILEIRRNWREDDDRKLAKQTFVKFPFAPGLGFYQTGLLHILGNATRALTAAWRLMLDNAMFSNFPGFLYSDVAGRQQTNEFRVPPGGGVKIQSGSRSIHDVVMALPYKEVGAGMVALVEKIEQAGARVSGVGEQPVAEGHMDAPVGTTLALIEQATKLLASVHVRLHAAQSEEFQLLKERFQEDPEAFWRFNRRPKEWQVEQFLQALDDYDLVPAADPNTPSHMHRIMKAVAIKQLQAMNPQLYDGQAVDTLILSMIGIGNPQKLFAPPQAAMDPSAMMPPPDPAKMAAVQQKAQEAQQEMQQRQVEHQSLTQDQIRQQQARMQEIAQESQDRAHDRQSRERVAQIREESERIKVQAELQKHQMQLQHENEKHQREMGMQQHQMAMDHHMQQQQATLDQHNRQQDQQFEQQNRQQELQHETQKHQQEMGMRQQEKQQDMQFEHHHREQDRAATAEQAQMKTQAATEQTQMKTKAAGEQAKIKAKAKPAAKPKPTGGKP